MDLFRRNKVEAWDSKAETREMRSWFQSCFTSHPKFSGRKAENDLKCFLTALGILNWSESEALPSSLLLEILSVGNGSFSSSAKDGGKLILAPSEGLGHVKSAI